MRTPGIGLVGLVAASLLLCAAAGADPTLYRWVDKDGHVHYGDQAAANARPVNPHMLNGGEDTSAANDDAKAAEADKQAAACKSKSDELNRYKGATTITETESLGNSREFTPEQKDQLVAKTQKYVDDHCAPAPPAN